jgi:hypothetical protein
MLHLPIHKLILKHTLGTAPIDQESHRLRIRRRLGTFPSHDTAVPRRTLVIKHGHPTRAGNRDPVPYAGALDRIVRDRAAVDHDLRVIRPTGLTDVDGALDVGPEAGDGVMMYLDVGIVALPGIIVDEVDSCARQPRGL